MENEVAIGHGKDFLVVLRMPQRGEDYMDPVERDMTTKKLPNKRVSPRFLAFFNHLSRDENWSRIGRAKVHKIIISERDGIFDFGSD